MWIFGKRKVEAPVALELDNIEVGGRSEAFS
jgi:hypothetical protein